MFGMFKRSSSWDVEMERQADEARREIARINRTMDQLSASRDGLSAQDRAGYLQHRRMWEDHLNWALGKN